jgi:hypothetical protein
VVVSVYLNYLSCTTRWVTVTPPPPQLCAINFVGCPHRRLNSAEWGRKYSATGSAFLRLPAEI